MQEMIFTHAGLSIYRNGHTYHVSGPSGQEQFTEACHLKALHRAHQLAHKQLQQHIAKDRKRYTDISEKLFEWYQRNNQIQIPLF